MSLPKLPNTEMVERGLFGPGCAEYGGLFRILDSTDKMLAALQYLLWVSVITEKHPQKNPNPIVIWLDFQSSSAQFNRFLMLFFEYM